MLHPHYWNRFHVYIGSFHSPLFLNLMISTLPTKKHSGFLRHYFSPNRYPGPHRVLRRRNRFRYSIIEEMLLHVLGAALSPMTDGRKSRLYAMQSEENCLWRRNMNSVIRHQSAEPASCTGVGISVIFRVVGDSFNNLGSMHS